MTVSVSIANDQRLRTIHDLVLPGAPAADVGTDHAHLAVALVTSGRCPRVVASDRAPAAVAAARRTVRRAALIDRVSVRQADGFAAFDRREVATVVMAGVGGGLLARLLRRDAARLAGVRRLILGPNRDEPLVRRTLTEGGWRLVDEHVVASRGRLYWVLVAEPDAAPTRTGALTELDATYGPIARRRTDRGFRRFAAREASRLAACRAGLDRGDSARVRARRARIERARRLLDEALGGGMCTGAC